MENNFLKVVAEGCAIAAPCRSKVAEQLLEIGAKAGIAGLAGVAIKDIADKMTSDELDHLVTLKMLGNDEITGKYLSSLQDKYAPAHTGGDQIAGSGPTNTGGNQLPEQGVNHTGNNTGQADAGPSNTGGNQTVAQTPNNTGNTEGAPDLPTNYESSNKITQGQHAEIRNSEGRPVGAVINDVQKSRPADILLQDDGRWIVKGTGGKVHIIESNGEVVTSFYNPKANTDSRVRNGEWNRPSNEELEQFKQKFSDYVKW